MVKPMIVGNMGFDLIKIGRKKEIKTLGGSGLRMILGLSLQKIPTFFITAVGKEKIWRGFIEQLNQVGVDSKYIKITQRTIKFYIDYSEQFFLEKLRKIYPETEKELVTAADVNQELAVNPWLHLCPLPLSDQLRLIINYRKNNPNGFVSLQVHESEMDEKKINQLMSNLNLIDMIFVNEYEMNKLNGKVKKCKGYLFLTKGEKGVDVFFDDKIISRIGPPKLRKVVDVTGAGDAFASGVLATYWKYKNKVDQEEFLKMMLNQGTKLAGCSLENYGFDNIFKLLKMNLGELK